ncbi:hypothetical protein, partial [Methylobacterium oxalidis]
IGGRIRGEHRYRRGSPRRYHLLRREYVGVNRVLLCLPVLVWSAVTSAPAAQIERETFGCKSMANAERLTALRMSEDEGAYEDRLGRLLRAGECRAWAVDDAVTIEDEADSFVCLAPKGSRGHCFWSARASTGSP